MKLLRYAKALIRFIIGSILSIYCYRNIKVYFCNHFNIGIWNLYKKRTVFHHPIGIVIGFKVQIGTDCQIFQNVTIGTKDTQNFKEGSYPKIGNNVIIYPNSIIIGDINIGDNVIIGAGSIVLNDIPSDVVVAGSPAEIKKKRD